MSTPTITWNDLQQRAESTEGMDSAAIVAEYDAIGEDGNQLVRLVGKVTSFPAEAKEVTSTISRNLEVALLREGYTPERAVEVAALVAERGGVAFARLPEARRLTTEQRRVDRRAARRSRRAHRAA